MFIVSEIYLLHNDWVYRHFYTSLMTNWTFNSSFITHRRNNVYRPQSNNISDYPIILVAISGYTVNMTMYFLPQQQKWDRKTLSIVNKKHTYIYRYIYIYIDIDCVNIYLYKYICNNCKSITSLLCSCKQQCFFHSSQTKWTWWPNWGFLDRRYRKPHQASKSRKMKSSL